MIVEAVQWPAEKPAHWPSWGIHHRGNLQINTLEGVMVATPGDYIIKGVADEIYPCKPDIFHKTYTLVNDSQPEVGQRVLTTLEGKRVIATLINIGGAVFFRKDDGGIVLYPEGVEWEPL